MTLTMLTKEERGAIETDRVYFAQRAQECAAGAAWWLREGDAAAAGDRYAWALYAYDTSEDLAWELRHGEMLPPGFSFAVADTSRGRPSRV